ncbi:MAG TPA: glycosyltransferase family 2 protein [Flavisolibacter sp.]|nr:glycosyltransferase family 2 protein [Flavisolibacter sp.]
MQPSELFLWLAVFIIFYAYLGYGILLWVLVKMKGKKYKTLELDSFTPKVTLIIPAYNEEAFIRQKIENTRLLEYPEGKLDVIFVTDGSSDKTPEIIASCPEFKLMHNNERKGKVAAMNRSMREVQTPYVIFCDANTILNKRALLEIVKHYADPKVGGVAGEKKVLDLEQSNSAGKGESLYWRYESALKQLDSDYFTVVGAAGELFSFRTELFEAVNDTVLLDDFIISLKICQKGFRVAYEPNAYAMEKPSMDIKEEQKRKVRISAGAFQSMIILRSLLNIFRYPKLSFQYISHRVLRWALCPFLLPIILILNISIVNNDGNWVYKGLLIAQITFYLFAFIGWQLSANKKKAGIFNFPYYFLFMNISLYQGLGRFLNGSQSVIWDKAKRNI